MYRLRGGLGVFAPPSRPDFIDPGYPADARIVAQNTAANDAFQVGMQVAQASNNYDQCEQNAQNANSQAQYDAVMAACRGQAAQQTAPEIPTLQYATPGKPLSYTPGGPAIPTPTYTVPAFATNQPAFTPPVAVMPPPVVVLPPAPVAISPAAPAPVPPPGSSSKTAVPISTCYSLPSLLTSSPIDKTDCLGPMTLMSWGLLAAAGLALFSFGKGGR